VSVVVNDLYECNGDVAILIITLKLITNLTSTLTKVHQEKHRSHLLHHEELTLALTLAQWLCLGLGIIR
jgi:uncharacterized BrkB/YihY/UPF0761 family membrane protein